MRSAKRRLAGTASAILAISAVLAGAPPAKADSVYSYTFSDNIRYPDGVWQGWQPPVQPPGASGTNATMAVVDVADNLNDSIHVDIADSDGIWDDVRYADGTWQGWEKPPQPPISSGYLLKAAGLPDGDIEYFVVGSGTGAVYTSTRSSDGNWGGWSQPLTVPGGELGDFAATADANGNVQVIASVPGGAVYHALQFTDGAWQNWEQPTQVPGGAFAVTAAGSDDGSVQFMAVNGDDMIYHDIRFPDGSWQGWLKVPYQPPAGWDDTSSPATGMQFDDMAATADVNDNAQFLIAVHGPTVPPGKSLFYHIVRYSNGDWQSTGWGVVQEPYGLCSAGMANATFNGNGGLSQADAVCMTGF
jgi:hypothetical protein